MQCCQLVDDYIISKKLGHGAQGSVWKVYDKNDKQYAIKKYENKKLAAHEQCAFELIGEHENIIKVHKYIETDEYSYLVMEFANGGTLYDHLLYNRTFSEGYAKRHVLAILNALVHIQMKGIIHRDLKLENIVLVPSGSENSIYKLKLIDFGLCTKPGSNDLNVVGSIPYIAPEIQKGKGASFKSDMWSLGVIIFELLFGYTPFQSEKPFEEPIIFPKKKVSNEVKHLIKMLLLHDECKRYKLYQVLTHPWIAGKKGKLWKKSEIIATTSQQAKCSYYKFIKQNRKFYK